MNPHRWTVTDRTTAFKARRWEVERSTRFRAGDPTAHEFFLIRIPDFVHVIPVTTDGNLVMVRQFRHGLEAPTLEFPGGLLDATDACPASAARREMKEETGYDAPILRPLPILNPNPALLTNRAHFFVAEQAVKAFETALEATEDVAVVLMPLAEAREKARAGTLGLTNAAHLAALFLSGLI
jgi:ADP-ribose pyrophosphatase